MAYQWLWPGLQLHCSLLCAKQPLGWYPPMLHTVPHQLSVRRGRAHTPPLSMTWEWGNDTKWKMIQHGAGRKICMFTFLGVNLGTAAIADVDIDGSAMRGNLQETIWPVCQSKDSFRMFVAATDRYHTWLVAQSESACLPITVSPDVFVTVALPFNQQKHQAGFNQHY